MRRQLRSACVALGLLAVVASCRADRPNAPAEALISFDGVIAKVVLPSVRISEIHYDNPGTDATEGVEIAGPAGMSLTGWSVIPYNGANGQTYSPITTLDGPLPASCGTRGVLFVPIVGFQNGSPDGVALVDAGGNVVEFLSYEGTFNAANGPALGLRSTDIVVQETGAASEALVGGQVRSLKRSDQGVWSGPTSVNSLGVCNEDPAPEVAAARVEVLPATTDQFVGEKRSYALTTTAYDAADAAIPGAVVTWSTSNAAIATVSSGGIVTVVAPGEVVITATAGSGVSGSVTITAIEPVPLPPTAIYISELHYDNVGDDEGEAIEVEGPAGTNMAGWSLVLYNGSNGLPYTTTTLTGTFANSCSDRGTLFFSYPMNGIQNGSPDAIALVNSAGAVVEFISYEGVFRALDGPAVGRLSTDIVVSENGSALGRSLQRDATGWFAAASSFGACNVAPGPFVSIVGRTADDPPLPVGFEDQLFATLNDGRGGTTPSTFTWISETTDIASINEQGVIRALAEGTAVIRATSATGGTGTFFLNTTNGVLSSTALYVGNTEFGEPTDADASDDFIVRRAQYTASFNRNRGIPNWVSSNLEATHFGDEDRCDCFTFDPLLPADFARYTTADYTGAGAFAGFGIDRGHLVRSFDRTSASLDNAVTYYFTNIIPQTNANNTGPWAAMEDEIGDLAHFQNKEIYQIAGASGSRGTVKDEGKITIPASVWKVVVIMPRDQGLANVDSYDDVEVIAVIMPNEPTLSLDWNDYRTTVDVVEALSGYDLLALLPDAIEAAVESNSRPPVAVLGALGTSTEGASVPMTGAGSTDPDEGDALTYAWNFGDGTTGSGADVTHTYVQNGSYLVTLTVTDSHGLSSTATGTAVVTNVAPTFTSFSAPATATSGILYSVSAGFSDVGVNDAPWSYSINWNDGAPSTGSVSSQSIIVGGSHRYLRAGTYPISFTITDRDGGFVTRDAMVEVKRLSVPGEIDHDRIRIRNRHLTGAFTVLSTSTFDARTIVPASVRIGTVGITTNRRGELSVKAKDENRDRRPDLIMDFSIRELIDAGLLTLKTVELVLTADLTDGRQIVSRVAIRPLGR